MLQEYGGKVPPSDQVSLDDLKEVVAAYNRSMNEALNFVDERKPGMVAMLDKCVKETLEELSGVIVDLRSGKYDDGAAVVDDVIALLDQAEAKYESVHEKSARFKGYEELFGQPVTNFVEVEQVTPAP